MSASASFCKSMQVIATSEKRTSQKSRKQHILPANSSRSTNKLLAGAMVPRNGYSSVLWMLCAIVFCSCFSSSLCDDSEVTELPTVSGTPYYSATPQAFDLMECINSFDSSVQRKYICGANPELFPILKYAEQVAKKTCEEDFFNDYWNCSKFSLLREPNVTKGDNLYKESAYVDALSLAVITHTVALGCAQDVLNCSCDGSEDKPCADHDVAYGLHIAKTFLSQRSTSEGLGLKQQLVLHNVKAAETTIYNVMNSTSKSCSCHGISGSCTFTVCHSELPSFPALAKKIKEAYNNVCKVTPSGHSRNDFTSECITEANLVYTTDNSWCLYDPSIGSLGIEGRECNPHASAPNSCNKLCGNCKRGSQERVVVEEKQCDCEFYFCCDIKCKTCTERRTHSSCV